MSAKAKAKILGIIGLLMVPVLSFVALVFYINNATMLGIIWTGFALVWAVCAVINFYSASRLKK